MNKDTKSNTESVMVKLEKTSRDSILMGNVHLVDVRSLSAGGILHVSLI